MPPKTAPTTSDLIRKHIHQKYLGSKDIEVTDSIDFCEYFVLHYGNAAGKVKLKDKFVKLEQDLRAVAAWNPPDPITTVVPPDPEDFPEFRVAPWQLGFTEKHSVKGKSKLVYIMDTVDNFLKKPYDSKTEPLQVLFGPRSQVGATVEDWSMILHIGMGKASAARMILEAVSEMNLDMETLRSIANILKALFRMKCTYDPADTEEEQIDRAFAGKCIVTERPRPDPIMMALKWNGIIQKQGLDFQSVIDGKIAKFNANKEEGFGVLDHEIAFVKAYPHQSEEYTTTLEKHWQNFKPPESAVPPKRLAYADLSPDTKVKRCEKTNVLFNKVLTWSQVSNELWMIREIGIFCRAIKDAQRANKKVSLRNNAKAFRSKPNEISHDEICVFVYFMPEFKQHTTESQFQDLMTRLSKGYLDRELHEKAKTMDEKLTVWDFRFLTMITGKEVVKVQGPTSLEHQAQECEIALFVEKLKDEVKLWLEYKRAKQVWDANTRAAKRKEDKIQDIEIKQLADNFCSTWAPIAKKSEEAVTPFVCESIATWAEKESLSKDKIWTIWVLRFDVLGPKYHTNLLPALRLISDYISNNIEKSGAIVIAPNTGKDDAYNEAAIDDAVQEVDDTLREDQWPFRVRRGSLSLDETSLGPRSKRPGCVTAWMVTSNSRDSENPKIILAELEKCFLFKRRRAHEDLKVLPDADYVNPCAALVRASQGSQGLSKAQRSKQWHTGVPFWTGIRESTLKGLGLRVTDGVAWIDAMAYDDKLQRSVVQAYGQRSAQVPRQMIISPIWANMGVYGPEDSEKVDNARIEKFIRKSVRDFVANSVRNKSITFDELAVVDPAAAPATVAPTLQTNKFIKTCPNSAGFLPLRQDILDLLYQKIQGDGPRSTVEKVIEDHNKAHNPSGVPFKGEAKRPAPQTDDGNDAKDAKTYEPEPNGPKSREEFEEAEIFPGQSSDHEFMIKDGKLRCHALEDCIISSRKPICKFWGEYLCGTERKKDIAKHKNQNYMWEMNSLDFLGAFSWQKNPKEIEPFKDHRPCKLSEFMTHLEDKGRVNFRIECHDLAEISESSGPTVPGQEVSGTQVTKFELKSSEDCLFLPKPLPAKSKPSKANAASGMDLSKWNFPGRTHTDGRVKMEMAMSYDEEANSIIPVKPMVYLVAPVKMKKGDFVLLG